MTLRSTVFRGTVAVAVSGVLALTGCSSDAKSSGSSSTSSDGVVVGTESVPAGGTGTATESVQTYEPLTSLEPAEARTTFGVVYKNLLVSRTAPGAAADAARVAALSGQQLKVGTAEAKTSPVNDDSAKPDPEAVKTPPVFLTVTTRDSAHKLVLGEAQPQKENLPELYLMETPDAVSSLKLTHVARMLPKRRLQKLQPPANGTPEVAETTPINGTSPAAMLQKYGAYVSYPLPKGEIDAQPFRTDPYITAVRNNAETRDTDLGEHGTYTVKNAIVPGTTRVLKRSDGAMIVFTHVLRTETVTVKNGASIPASATMQAVTPALKTIAKGATMQTDVCLAFYMYPTSKAELVAASEQLLSAAGS